MWATVLAASAAYGGPRLAGVAFLLRSAPQKTSDKYPLVAKLMQLPLAVSAVLGKAFRFVPLSLYSAQKSAMALNGQIGQTLHGHC